MEVIRKAQLAKEVLSQWQNLESSRKNQVLNRMADLLLANTDDILQANAQDVLAAKDRGISTALLDRLTLTATRVQDMAAGLKDVALLPDPVGQVISGTVRPNGLRIENIRVPLGLVAMIYEARPNVTADAAGLCLKAGNGVILRGGSEAINSNKQIVSLLRQALEEESLSPEILQIIEDTSREQVQKLLRLNEYIDVIIPRGGAGLIKTVIENATVPVIQTGEGVCHIFIDESANHQMTLDIVDNAKTQRPGVCNAVETLLVHQKIAPEILPLLKERLQTKGVKLIGCEQTKGIVPDVELASEQDWSTEYLDLILAVKVVNSLDEAIKHINYYGTQHSEAILTESYTNAQRFLKEVDAAAVYVNASTRFTDGSQFGLGAEIGISTQKLHARGPMGLVELTTNKFIVYGNGHSRG
ncbi:MAG: glutamate-5-semialdehyde dehydrogenase [Firmicutes bacterium]|nr:glutamate-5-semialdehyde dehydrogenase [Bacillota bacterium]